MEKYIKLVIYSNIPPLLLLTPIAAYNLVTGGNVVALAAFYNFVLYIIPVTIMLIYLIHRLRKGFDADTVQGGICFVLATACMVLLVIGWMILTPVVILVSTPLSFTAVKIYTAVREKAGDTI